MELERRIELLQGEREGLSSTLDESADRIIMLEKQTRDQDSIVSISMLLPEISSNASQRKNLPKFANMNKAAPLQNMVISCALLNVIFL